MPTQGTTSPFPNGQVLQSSALAPEDVQVIFQLLVLQILNITVDPANPNAAYSQVRVDWQTQGQPAYKVGENICFIKAIPIASAYGKVSDRTYTPNDEATLIENWGETQVWRVSFMFNGPRGYLNARLVRSAFELDWVLDYLGAPPRYATELHFVNMWEQPTYSKELYQGTWWWRSELQAELNELTLKTITVPSAASARISIITDNGITQTVDIEA